MKIKWQPIVKAKSSILFQWYVFEGHKGKWFQSSINLKIGLTNGKIVSDEIFIDLNEWAKLEEFLASKVKADKNFLKNFIGLCLQRSDELIKTSKRVRQVEDWQKVDSDRLLSLYRKYQNSVLNLMPFLNAILVLDGILKKEIVISLETDLGIKDKNEQDLLLSKLVIPKKKSYFVKENERILKTALKVQENKQVDIKQDIKDYLKRYAWISSIAYLKPFLTESDVMRKVEILLRENPEEKLAQIEQTKKKKQEGYEGAFDQIKRSRRLVELVDLACEFIYLQTYRFDVFSIAHYQVYPLFGEIGRRFGLKVEELVYLTGEEIVKLVEGKAEVGKEEIKNRIKNYALIEEDGKYTLLSGGEVTKVVGEIVEGTTVKGMVASRGRATGEAKLVTEVEDVSKVNRGDIIISPMTHPKLIVAITKAAGIITDFGGMLCHAAIVAREFGIPCVVGTGNATKVFKDGDLVEVNAYDGTARKL